MKPSIFDFHEERRRFPLQRFNQIEEESTSDSGSFFLLSNDRLLFTSNFRVGIVLLGDWTSASGTLNVVARFLKQFVYAEYGGQLESVESTLFIFQSGLEGAENSCYYQVTRAFSREHFPTSKITFTKVQNGVSRAYTANDVDSFIESILNAAGDFPIGHAGLHEIYRHTQSDHLYFWKILEPFNLSHLCAVGGPADLSELFEIIEITNSQKKMKLIWKFRKLSTFLQTNHFTLSQFTTVFRALIAT